MASAPAIARRALSCYAPHPQPLSAAGEGSPGVRFIEGWPTCQERYPAELNGRYRSYLPSPTAEKERGLQGATGSSTPSSTGIFAVARHFARSGRPLANIHLD